MLELRLVIFDHSAYAEKHTQQWRGYANRDSGWIATATEEVYQLISLILFMGWYPLPEHEDYWKTS